MKGGLFMEPLFFVCQTRGKANMCCLISDDR